MENTKSLCLDCGDHKFDCQCKDGARLPDTDRGYQPNQPLYVQLLDDDKTIGIKHIPGQYIAIMEPVDGAEEAANLFASAGELVEALEEMLKWARRVKSPNSGPEVLNAINTLNRVKNGNNREV